MNLLLFRGDLKSKETFILTLLLLKILNQKGAIKKMNKELNKETIFYVIEDLLDKYKYLSKISQAIKYRMGESLIGKGDIGVAEDRIKEINKYNI